MIQNEHQYRTSKTALKRFTVAAQHYQPSPDLHPKLAAAQLEAFQGQIETLRAELAEYEALKSQSLTLDTAPLEALGEDLIKARIATGMSQASLAKSLRLKPQQIQRYEASKYASASLSRVLEVARVLRDAGNH